jgi:hypothetical protein
MQIAIVTSITFDGHPRSSFEAGLRDSGAHGATIAPPYEAHGNYGLLNYLVQNAASIHPDLIVTAGGFVAANAAASMLNQANGDPQFVYLSGVLLNTNNPCNSGGVNQNIPIVNQARRDALIAKKVDPARVWLVVNNNNPISSTEIAAWGNANHHSFFSGAPNHPFNAPDTSRNNSFIDEFKALAAKPQPPLGLVISPDPYFRHFRTAFVTALADQLPVPVCYSYEDFCTAAAGTSNTANSVSLDQPRLYREAGTRAPDIAATAYYQLGYKAGQFLIAKASGHPRQFVGVTTWNGSAWM